MALDIVANVLLPFGNLARRGPREAHRKFCRDVCTDVYYHKILKYNINAFPKLTTALISSLCCNILLGLPSMLESL